ncbi:MAG TPA: hypothetical protein DD396_06050 [Bacteroidetes bacterium]|mgnify:CR=1 FL=1|jgi:hypothetical protein|nr:hypothetical protein [Bacteroidota bacterium]
MKSVLTILLTFLVLLAQAVTTLSGSIEINKINLTQLTVRYTFILDQQDSVFSADSFSSTIRCVGSSSNINLTNPVELSKTKQFLSCSNTSYKWNIVYGNTLDLGDTKFSAIGACCNLKIDASCGKRSNTISSLSTSLTDFYIYTQFENCNIISNQTPAYYSSLHSNNCLNQPYFFNLGTLDTANFDSISYRLVAPLSNTGSALSFKSGYYPDQPLIPYYPGSTKYPYSQSNATPPIGFYFDSVTGDCIYTPVNTGDAGPVAIEITEWRKDKGGSYQKISTSHIEKFISTSQCPENNPPTIIGKRDTIAIVGQTLCFNIASDDEVFIPPPPAPTPAPDEVQLSWNRGIPGASFNIINPTDRLQTGRFCWTPTAGDVRTLPYTFTVTARDNACPLNAVTVDTFKIKVNETAGISRTNHQSITLYPNPATSIVHLPFYLDKAILTNSIGQIVKEKQNTAVLEIEDLPSGIYFLSGEKNQVIYNARLIKN